MVFSFFFFFIAISIDRFLCLFLLREIMKRGTGACDRIRIEHKEDVLWVLF